MMMRDQLSRRGFVAALGAASAACATDPGKAPAKAGIQLYTVRAAMAQDMSGTLARIGAIGYREVEFAGYFNNAPAVVRRMLGDAGLTAPSAHVSRELIRDNPGPTIEAASAVGHKFLVMPWLPPEERTLEQYRAWADICNRFGAQCKQAGVRFAYHNHDFEFQPIDGVVPYDVLLERCDPALVEFELDLFWATKAHIDLPSFLATHQARVPMVHVKDMSAAGEMVNVGAGTIDFAALFSRFRFAHYFAEHDTPADPMATAEGSYRGLAAALAAARA